MRLAEAIAHKEKLPPEIRVLLDETMVPERPEIFVAVAATKIELAERGFGLRPYLKPVKPFLDWTFWRHGRRIEEEEALPFLRAALGAGWELPGRAEG
jgi:plasmid stability protein